MKRKLLLALLVTIIISSCSSSDNSGTQINRQELENVLAAEWQTFSQGKTNFGGGLAMQILAPKGNYFISTGMGSEVNWGKMEKVDTKVR